MINSINYIFDKFSSVRVLLLGDTMLDKYVYGNVDRISPEAPVPVLLYKEEKNMLGGAGNVFRNLIAINGKKHILLTAAGKDERKVLLKKLLDNTANYHLYIEPERKTTMKLRMVVQEQQIVRCDEESTIPLSPNTKKEIMKDFSEYLESADIVVLSDYNKGFFSGGFAQEIIKTAKNADKIVLVDPKNRDYSIYAGADYVKPNRHELLEVSGLPYIKSIESLTDAARSLCRKYSISNMIVTLGQDGILFVPRNGKAIHAEVEHTPEIYDVSGAGDTVLAILALALASKVKLPVSLRLANTAAQIAISKSGTATVSPEEIYHYLHNHDLENSDDNLLNKIVTLKKAKELIKVWRNNGETICFTNGCFDLLHYGHISSFLQIKNHGGRLIVAINSDKSVKKLKGKLRPIQDEKTRATLLAVMQCIDLVIVFDEDTAVNLVKEICPDVIAKEGYSLENWPEALIVKKYGGKIVFLKEENGYSTSNLINKIVKYKES